MYSETTHLSFTVKRQTETFSASYCDRLKMWTMQIEKCCASLAFLSHRIFLLLATILKNG